MNRISLILISLMLFTGFRLNSQTTEGTNILDYTGLQNKLKKSDADIQDPKKNVKVKTWTNRAELLMQIFNVNNDVLKKGETETQVKLFYKDPQEIKTSQEGADKIEEFVYEWITIKFRNGVVDDWTETKKITEDPLGDALKALEEASKLNVDGKNTSDIKKLYDNLKINFETAAVFAYQKKDFGLSEKNFVTILNIDTLPVMQGKIDTVIIYHAGLVAFENGDFQNAAKYFQKVYDLKYNEPYLYVNLKQAYFAIGDTAKGVAYITEGFKKYPNNQSIQIELINYYLTTGQSKEALKLLSMAEEGDSTNVSYRFAEGTIYDKLNDYDKAEAAYQKCIAMNPDYFDAYFNLGVLYNNKARVLYEAAAKITDNAEYEKAKSEADSVLAKAIPYFVRASEINPDDRSPLDDLKTIYYRLQMNDKYQEVVTKLNNF